jgi:RNA polymerase sigma-70 factor (ECF subfamily)
MRDREVTVRTDESELARLFEQHHGLVFSTAYRITGNAADAEDVLQTVFLRLFRRDADGTMNVEKGESYLRRAAINASIDLLRERRTKQTLLGSETSLDELSAASSHPSPATGYELKECLRRALANLDTRAAEVFALRFFEDYSNRQIAAALGLSQVLVAVMIHRARRQLQDEIRSCLGGRL